MQLYHIGEEKIIKELDCVNVLTKLRQLDIVTSLFLNKKQKFLLNFQKKNLITEKSHKMENNDSSSSDDDQSSTIFRKFTEKNGLKNKGYHNQIKLHDALKTYSSKHRNKHTRHSGNNP